MVFEVTRASNVFDGEKKPYEKCFPLELNKIDISYKYLNLFIKFKNKK